MRWLKRWVSLRSTHPTRLLCLHHDRSLHLRMQAAEILERPSLREREGKLLAGVERRRSKAADRDHRMRDVVLVGPGDGITKLHDELLRTEGEVVDLHLEGGGLCGTRQAGRERKKERGGTRAAQISRGCHFF